MVFWESPRRSAALAACFGFELIRNGDAASRGVRLPCVLLRALRPIIVPESLDDRYLHES